MMKIFLLLSLFCWQLLAGELENLAIKKAYNQNSDILSQNLNYAIFAPLDENLNDASKERDYELFASIYGADKKEVSKNLTSVFWLNEKVLFNTKNGASIALIKVSDELKILLAKKPEYKKFLKQNGTFAWRKIAREDGLSAHSYGIAIDINVKNSSYWHWHKKRKNTLPKEIVDIFEKNGFIWGGRWQSFDTMHFEYRPEFLIYEKLKNKL